MTLDRRAAQWDSLSAALQCALLVSLHWMATMCLRSPLLSYIHSNFQPGCKQNSAFMWQILCSLSALLKFHVLLSWTHVWLLFILYIHTETNSNSWRWSICNNLPIIQFDKYSNKRRFYVLLNNRGHYCKNFFQVPLHCACLILSFAFLPLN